MNFSGSRNEGRELNVRPGVFFWLGYLLFTLLCTGSLVADEIPSPVKDILSTSCLECHDAETEKGEINLEQATIEVKFHRGRLRILRLRPAARPRDPVIPPIGAILHTHPPCRKQVLTAEFG